MSQAKIFYSWQSDLPNTTNRGFIEKSLHNAIKMIKKDGSIELDPVIDRDTDDVPGAPDIAGVIFSKIDEAEVFVGDVSIINDETSSRPTPNPNVLVELGYALKTLGPTRIIVIMNTAYGEPSRLPFDLRMRRVITYKLLDDPDSKKTERKALDAALGSSLRSIFEKASLKDKDSYIQASETLDSQFSAEIVYEIRKLFSSDHLIRYDLNVRLVNTGASQLQDYRIEVEFPSAFLNQSTYYSAEVLDRKTETHRFFRITNKSHNNIILYPGDSLPIFSLDYQVHSQIAKSDAMKESLRITAYSRDTVLRQVFIPMTDAAKFLSEG